MLDGRFFCYSLEDEFREVKVPGETRIPHGTYVVKYRKEVTPLTKKYRQKFPWFKWHIEIIGVHDYDYVYIHIGNDDGDTDACVVVGDEANNNKVAKGFIGKSTQAYERFYKAVAPELDKDKPVIIELKNVERKAA